MSDVLCVSLAYQIDGKTELFHGKIVPDFLIERFLNLEMGKINGLFIPVGDGKQVRADFITWFRIVRLGDNDECPDQCSGYAL